ncbi:zinc finger protein 862-like isoform X1 [Epinephelus moara]|uniref:zinc finger protein 862-like isoform X1 n=1 Tax=Epinephelus moara TaxID=300413 RepID=UPI00214DF59D|nr:zinc finger protein 862-like isoform X1 [Epinephelus moara]
MKELPVGKTYRNKVEARVFLHYIADMERKKIEDRLGRAKFISIMSDGSTDSAVKEQEMVYVRSSVGGKIESKFVGIDAVDKADAENITKAIKDVMDKVSQQWEVKLVAVATDGAAVMVGVRTGVVQRLRRDRPYLVGVHCMAHRLELSFKDSVKNIVLFKKVEELLTGLYTFYHVSPLNRSHLKNSFAALKLAPIMPTRVGGTRWVAHLLCAIDHFLRGYPAIMHHLNGITSPDVQGVSAVQQCKAKSFSATAKEAVVLRFSGFLHDTLSHLSRVSERLQKSDISIADAHSCLSSTHAVLESYKTRFW